MVTLNRDYPDRPRHHPHEPPTWAQFAIAWAVAVVLGVLLALAALVFLGIPKANAAPPRDTDEEIARRQREREALAVLALSGAGKPAPAIVAPPPREKGPGYAEAYRQAVASGLPLVVFVGCEGQVVEGAVGVRWDGYPGVTTPAVVVGYPSGGKLVQDAVLPCPVERAVLGGAIRAAVGKSDKAVSPAAPAAPAPLNWQIYAAPVCLPGRA